MSALPVLMVVRGTLHVGGQGIGLGAGQCSLGVRDCDFVVARVKVDDRSALWHLLVLVNIDLRHLAGDARTHLDQVAVHLRIIGVLGEGGVPPEGDRRHEDDCNDNNDDAPAAGPRLYDLGRRIRLGLYGCCGCFRHVHFPPR